MEPSALRSTIIVLCLTIGGPAILYFGILGSLIAVPSLQAHVTYLHRVALTWSKDLNVPEQFGFARHQVTPFYISTTDGERLHSWHILPLVAYIENQPQILSQGLEGGLVHDFGSTLNFRLLKENKSARLVLYFHGTSGTMASGWRPDSYRSLYAADPLNTHILAFDYRGYGESSGYPSEQGVINDALAVTDWALNTAEIPPENIVIYGQSLGSAVALALVNEYSKRYPEIRFAGLVVTATFSDMARLTATYRIGGIIPVLSPIAKIPPLFKYFTSQLSSKWDNMQRIAEFITTAQQYDITFLHAEDDADISMEHSKRLFHEAIRVVETLGNYSGDDGQKSIDERLHDRQEQRGEGGSLTVWPTKRGPIRLEIPKYGVHDKIMSYPATSIAISRAFARHASS
ncbi:Alpha/Beta hydrolase protein [Stachybotrys elegans]|uniref:Alpha/Beta hydrolase protein n=1 Tax=Stachybotrys elegans TaxID=80388 RepID=A0A8K0T3B7_9HYPO|nr:Alpha/Beta hydrolase protein [Stachybotrys elegans]